MLHCDDWYKSTFTTVTCVIVVNVALCLMSPCNILVINALDAIVTL